MIAGAADVVECARQWIAGDPDPETRKELEDLIQSAALEELAERLGPELDFGTAGLRGKVGAGPARMNRAVIVRATRAVAEHLLVHVPDSRTLPVVVGYDARPTSRTFAEAAAGVLLAAGIPVRWFEEPAPTPLVAYAARVLAASGALVVTASHNPREDNGLKVYGPSAAQIAPPADADVAERRRMVGPASHIPCIDLANTRVGALDATLEPVPSSLLDRYFAELCATLPAAGARRPLRIAYTPLHGLGLAPVRRALSLRGFTELFVVDAQAEPDGTFPTTPMPNPEQPGTLDQVLELATRCGADLVLANDPDVDRLAAATPLQSSSVPVSDEDPRPTSYQVLSGNELGALLADFVLEHSPSTPVPLLVTSVVSSPMLARIAEARGARVELTLTGFKWIWAAARALEQQGGVRFSFGCEEALGYCVGHLVRDKDGISAATWLAELAYRCRSEGQTLIGRLHALYARHGAWGSAQRSLKRSGSAGANAIRHDLARLRSAPPERLGHEALSQVIDYRVNAEQRAPWLGADDLLELRYGSRARVLVRPSGTEPKLKIYADTEELQEGVAPEEALRSAQSRAVGLAEELQRWLEPTGA